MAAMLAFVYAYFGFVASLHHTDGRVPTGKALVFSALTCEHTHAQISPDSEATECGTCEFLAALTSPALSTQSADCPPAKVAQRPPHYWRVFCTAPSTLHGPRAPPSA